jgi:hypothetical protein
MFISSFLAQPQRATADGVPVNGCFHWSLMEDFERTAGLGLRGVDEDIRLFNSVSPEAEVRILLNGGERGQNPLRLR